MKYFYGLLNVEELKDICKEVVKLLGGGINAEKLILETAIVETLAGTYRAPVRYNFGLGLTQFDKIAFDDIQSRTSKARKKLILDRFNIDLDLLEYRDLANSPILSLLFCRLFYLLKPGAIPDTLEGRGDYWKKHYNTHLGAGSVEGYIKKVNDFKKKVM